MSLSSHKSLFLIFIFLTHTCFASESTIDSLQKLIKIEQDSSKKIRLMVDLSRRLQRPAKRTEKAIEVATRAVELASSKDSILYAHTLNNLGLLLRFDQQYKPALQLHKRAFHLIEHEPELSIERMIYANNTGVAARYASSYDIAVKYYLVALDIAEKTQDKRNIEISCNGLGNTFMAIPGREELALEYLERALSIAKAEGNRRGEAIQYLTIGSYYTNLKQYAKARLYFDNLLQINQEIKDEKGIGMSLKALGESYLEEGKNLDAAQEFFHKALRLFEKINDKQQQSATLLQLGQLMLEKRHYTLSLKHLEHAKTLAMEQDDKSLLQNIALTTSKLFEAQKKYPLALEQYKLSRDYQDSINLQNQSIQIAAINRQYNISKKETEIELLKAEQEISDIQLSKHASSVRNRGVIILLLAALFLALAVVFLLQIKNRKNQEKTNKLLQESERKHIKAVYEKNLAEAEILASQMRINPHFLFNCLNAIKTLIQQNKNKEAMKYLLMLARFSRSVLETANQATHTLKDEIELIRFYIELEKNRFDDSFKYKIDNQIGDHVQKISIPPMLLQPFVENAIWHGLLPCDSETKQLTITISNIASGISISIDDTGVGRFNKIKSNKEHKSRGTEITNKRIELFNNTHTNKIKYQYIDKKDEVGLSLGTCIQINIKTNNYENSNS